MAPFTAARNVCISAVAISALVCPSASAENCDAFPKSCDCWNHVGQFAATNNGHGCNVPAPTQWGPSDDVEVYPRLVFCTDMPTDGVCGQSECQDYFRTYEAPCSALAQGGCWVPYVKTSEIECAPHKCEEFGKFTAKSKYINGGFDYAEWSKSACGEGDTTAFEPASSCPDFDIDDASAVYPSPSCIPTDKSAGVLAEKAHGFVVVASLVLGVMVHW